ncbi:MAG: MBOAT family protein, partial [Deltaproteobacteria bacterium]|nr:MBOAT family protein [Deltaproteobacteria bacterium]
MLFNSLEFGVFFFIVYALYLMLGHRWQNRMLLMASYVFYGAWAWRFLSLIFISTILDYLCGIKIYESDSLKRKRFFLFCSIIGNLTILGFFKYFNFFASNLQALLSHFGFSIQPHFLNLILPVGISFYTFQSMSYTIDIYRNQMEPTRNFLDFALFVAFFPQLVAGPIERARRLLPQILAPRKITLDKFYAGCYLIFWGLFQKVFIADNLARIVDPIFAAGPPYNGAMVLIALYGFAFQILCDFAGYSNIARGLGKCLGFDIIVNFNLPYFSTS